MFFKKYKIKERERIDREIVEAQERLDFLHKKYSKASGELSTEYADKCASLYASIKNSYAAANNDLKTLEHDYHSKCEQYGITIARKEEQIKYLDAQIEDKQNLLQKLTDMVGSINLNTI